MRITDHAFSNTFDELRSNPDIWREDVLNIRNEIMAQDLNPYPGYPASINGARFSFILRWPEDDKLMTQGFKYIWGAYYFLNYMIDGNTYKWESERRIRTSTGMTIESDELEKVIEYTPTTAERLWRPPAPYNDMYLAFLKKKRIVASPDPVTGKYSTHVEGRRQRATRSDATKAPDTSKRETPSSARARPTRKASATAGLTSIGDIASSIKMEPRVARQILRQTKTPKHEGGWAWPADQVEKIKSILNKGKKK